MRLKVADIHCVHGVALALDVDYGALALCGDGYSVEVDARGEYSAVVMIGMISAYFGSAGCAEESRLAALSVELLELADNAAIALSLGIDCARGIEPRQLCVIGAVDHSLFQNICGIHKPTSFP